jgi:hypothetical protein
MVVRARVQPARRPRATTGSNDWQPGAYRKALHETEGAWRPTGTTRTGVGSSVKRQASSGGRRVGRVGAAGKRRGRGLGAIMYHVATYLLCIPRALSRLTGALGTSWARANAGPCVRMQRPPAGNHRQPCSASPRHTGAESRASIECIKCRVQTECKAIAEPTAEPLQPAGGDAVCAAGAFAPKLSSQKSTTY